MYKILFVSKSKNKEIDSLILNQSESLKRYVEIQHFLINEGGIRSYIKSIRNLRKVLEDQKIDLIHAHYSYCGLIAVMSRTKVPLIVSFMGSDLHNIITNSSRKIILPFINKAISLIVQMGSKKIIIKSKYLDQYIFYKTKSCIIPNGVDLNYFKPQFESTLVEESKDYLHLNKNQILFLGNTKDSNKNFSLLLNAYDNYINKKLVQLLAPYPVKPTEIVKYINDCSVLVFTSFKEGSPNVIKEAMACNCPIVSTDVGDVRDVIGETEGCYISGYTPQEVASNIAKAMDFSEKQGKTNGRERILSLGLDSQSIAQKIYHVYYETIEQRPAQNR